MRCMNVDECMYVCMYVCMYDGRMYVFCMYVCLYVGMYVWTDVSQSERESAFSTEPCD